jgi:deoxyribonuclease-4
MPLGGGMVKAADRAHAIGATAIQVFGDNPTAWRRRAEPPLEAPAFRERLGQLGIGPVSIHAAYLVNLAGPEPDFFERSIEVLAADLRAAWTFAATFVNAHIGSHKGTSPEAAVRRVAEGVARVLEQVPDGPAAARLVLENGSGGGGAIGTNVAELARIAEAIDARGVPPARVGFCLDTAHLWGAGYEISDPAVIDDLLQAFGRDVGLERLAMIHLNDSKSALGSRTDRHEHLGAGQIGPAGLAHFLTHPLLRDVPFYLETPGMDEGYDAVNLKRARDLAAGRPLDPLPPEALTLRRSRTRRSHPADEEDVEPA